MAEKWVGLADVVPRPDSDVLLPGSAGAFVNLIAAADGLEEFKQLAAQIFGEYGLDLRTIQDCEPLASRLLVREVAESLLQEAEKIPLETRFAFGSFHNYPPAALA